MSSAISFGYTQPSDDCFHIDKVEFQVGELVFDPATPPELAWDYETPIHARVILDVDFTKLLEESGFSDVPENRDIFAAHLLWFSSKTKQKGRGKRIILGHGKNEVRFGVPGELLGGSIHVEVAVNLAKPGLAAEGAIVASTRGNRLWSSPIRSLMLEGEGARFTISPINFKDRQLEPADAMWKINIENDLFMPVQSGVRVYLNSGNRTTRAHLDKPDTKESKLWEKFLNAEIISQLLLHSDPSDFDHWHNSEDVLKEGTLGESVDILFNAIFPEAMLEDVQADIPLLFARVQEFVFGQG